MLFDWVHELFCQHNYIHVGTWNCTFVYGNQEESVQCPITFLECNNCGKRLVIKEADYYYKSSVLKLAKLWENREIDIKFDSLHESENSKVDK